MGVRLDRFTVVLLASIFVFLGSLEAVCRARFDRTSRVQQREVSQRKAALGIHDLGTKGSRHVVMLGNSLMLEGVDVPVLSAKINPIYTPVPYFVLGTNYYDWYFGLKRLFAEGMRPEYVVIGLSPNQLATDAIRGDISSRYLFQQTDLLSIAQRTHMNATSASELVLAHYSEFYGTREIIRGYVMSRTLPWFGEWLHTRFAAYRDPELTERVLKPIAAERLEALNQLCNANGAHLIFVVPPTYQKGSLIIAHTGEEKGIRVLVPVGDEDFDASRFQSDGFHLNASGALEFTERLTVAFNKELE
jgi:hypothetical protein